MSYDSIFSVSLNTINNFFHGIYHLFMLNPVTISCILALWGILGFAWFVLTATTSKTTVAKWPLNKILISCCCMGPVGWIILNVALIIHFISFHRRSYYTLLKKHELIATPDMLSSSSGAVKIRRPNKGKNS